MITKRKHDSHLFYEGVHFKIPSSTHAHTPHLHKSSPTGVTAVGLLSRVNARVSLQVGRSVELGTAHVTAVRLVACRGKGQRQCIGFK